MLNQSRMRYLILVVLLINTLVANSQIEGVWIPSEINWVTPSTEFSEIGSRSYSDFSILILKNDSTFAIVSSTQSKYDNDSIFFKSEPGFILNKGKWVFNNEKNVELTYRLLYTMFPYAGQKVPSDEIKDIAAIVRDSLITYLLFNEVKYEITNMLYQESVDTLDKLIMTY